MTESDAPARLLLEQSPTAGGGGVCLDDLTDPTDPTSVLSVLYTETVVERAQRLERRAAGIASAAFVVVGATSGQSRDAVRRVGSASDLTGVGVAVTDWVTARDHDENAVVCLEGLSTLLTYADTERVFRFLHAIRSKCRSRGVCLHAHLTPSAHDAQTVATIKQVFDEQQSVTHARKADSAGRDLAPAAAENSPEDAPRSD